MSKADCKCKKSAECEECPEWIFTFADLVMLMMGFFVILWVLKPAPPQNETDRQVLPMDLLIAIREAFQHIPDPTSKDPVDIEMIKRKLEKLQSELDAKTAGKLSLSFTVNATGRVIASQATGLTEALDHCIEPLMLAWRWDISPSSLNSQFSLP